MATTTTPIWSRVRPAPVVMWIAVIALAVATPGLLSARGLTSLTSAIAPILIIAVGLTGAIIAGLIDFSIVQIAEGAALATALALQAGLPMVPAVGAGLGFGIAIGLINGILVGVLRVSALMSTLAMSLILTGAALVTMNGPQSILVGALMNRDGAALLLLGRSDFASVSILFIVAIVVVALASVFFNLTRAGRSLGYVGSSSEAAWNAGYDSRYVALGAMVWSGFFGALAGIAFLCQSGIAVPAGLSSYLVPIFAAVLAGAVVGRRRRISLATTVFGVALIVTLQNALTVFGFEAWVMYVVEGAVVLALFSVMALAGLVPSLRARRRRQLAPA